MGSSSTEHKAKYVSSFTAFDFYELLYLLATILSLNNVVALHKKPHFPA